MIAKKAEPNVISGLENSILTGDMKYKIVKPVPKDDFNELATLKEHLSRLAMKEKRIRDAYENGIDSLEEYRQNKTRIKNEKDAVSERISRLASPADTPADFCPKEQLIRHVRAALAVLTDPAADNEAKGNAIRSVVDKIVYDKKTEHLDFFFYLTEP